MDLRADIAKARLNFLLTELEMGYTFAIIAQHTDDPVKADRNRANALRAYKTALHFAEHQALSHKARFEIARRLEPLKEVLHKLGIDLGSV